MDRHLKAILQETPGGRKYLADLAAAKKAKRARHAPSRKAKEAKRAARADARDAMYAEVRARCEAAGGGCEFCGWQRPSEFHHLLSGGQRRHAEAVDNVAFICMDCHRQWHRGDGIALERGLMWAGFYGYGRTKAAIEYRLAKIDEARAARRTGT